MASRMPTAPLAVLTTIIGRATVARTLVLSPISAWHPSH